MKFGKDLRRLWCVTTWIVLERGKPNTQRCGLHQGCLLYRTTLLYTAARVSDFRKADIVKYSQWLHPYWTEVSVVWSSTIRADLAVNGPDHLLSLDGS